MQGVTETAMFSEYRAPLLVRPVSARQDLAEFIERNRDAIETRLLDRGALLFRGFDIRTVACFERVGAAVSSRNLDYTYRSTPRSAVGKGVFTATEYPPEQDIALHCENAYQRHWPLKIAFCCLVAPESGGETPIADMRRVTAAIGESLLEQFDSRGVLYVRHYRPFIDIPWEVVFQTSDRSEVAAYCLANDIAHEWLDASTLRTAQVNQGTAKHPVTGERVFFNQAHLFHVTNLDAAVSTSLIRLYGPDRLPRQAYYGDGEDISAEHLQRVRDAFAGESVSFPWQVGDVLLLDNMQMAHGRHRFTGKRQILATLLDESA